MFSIDLVARLTPLLYIICLVGYSGLHACMLHVARLVAFPNIVIQRIK